MHRLNWIAVFVSLWGCAGQPTTPASTPGDVDDIALEQTRRELISRHDLAPGLAQRVRTGTTSNDDTLVLEAITSGTAHVITGLAFDSCGALAPLRHTPPHAVAYVLVDADAKTVQPVAWRDPRNGDVVEVTTGYRLRVLAGRGNGTRAGKKGESFFVYGFGWYARWNRILPEPVIEQLDAFYTTGIEHVREKLTQYQEVAKPTHSGGDLQLVLWNTELLKRMSDWGNKLPAAPYVHLPDSGKVDIRGRRFEEAVSERRVVVDATSLEAYRASERTIERFGTVPSSDAIVKVLLAPFRRPELLSLVDRAILLDAVFEGKQPLRLIIDPAVEGGFFVPDDGLKEIHLAYSEVDLNFRYNGLIFAKLAHEAHHVVEFRQRPFLVQRCWYQRDDVIETLKYLNEFMWWVQHYPGDAPNWDWAPINAGIVLASLLEGYFPNSRC